MKNTLSHALTVLLATFMLVLIVCVINVFVVINKANDYHNTCIADIQASGYNEAIISSYMRNNTENLSVNIVNRTPASSATGDDSLEFIGRLYQVTTTYKITIPIINYGHTVDIVGYAR